MQDEAFIDARLSKSMKDGRCILTGCDANQFWLLDWWLKNLREHMPDIPVVVADFGLAKKMRRSLPDDIEFIHVGRLPGKRTWFMKPKAMLSSPYKYTCWLDLDCEIKKPIDDIFQYAHDGKLGLTTDEYAKKKKWAYWQSGVVVFKNKPKILEQWCKRSIMGIERGDMEALHQLVGESDEFIIRMPDEYQWLRLDIKYRGFNRDAKIVHWTGPRGKEEIIIKIKEQEGHKKYL